MWLDDQFKLVRNPCGQRQYGSGARLGGSERSVTELEAPSMSLIDARTARVLFTIVDVCAGSRVFCTLPAER